MKKIVGYTTGVYDLFHIGHLNIIKNAKTQCDFLIVGVTTDEEALRVKKKSPVIPFDERYEIVSAIKYVDMVVAEDNVDKLAAWEKYNYDVIIKGSDWRNSSAFIKLKRQLSSKDVKIVFFDYTEKVSSTKLRKILENKNKDSDRE